MLRYLGVSKQIVRDYGTKIDAWPAEARGPREVETRGSRNVLGMSYLTVDLDMCCLQQPDVFGGDHLGLCSLTFSRNA